MTSRQDAKDAKKNKKAKRVPWRLGRGFCADERISYGVRAEEALRRVYNYTSVRSAGSYRRERCGEVSGGQMRNVGL